ncbi:bcl-2-like protein 11 isoform X2 [Brachyhypopomus gauderio]|uniref:bcl-2-like protein 11 isoform X2 n=1 Tax=Brachyhypopomus gauderio TaxID=698409 RepID=UPI0040437312
MSRRQNRANGPAFLKEQGENGENTGGGTASRHEQFDYSHQNQGDQFRGGITNSLSGYHSRSPLFRTFSRSSSGYFSFDSEPSSPLMTHSTSTQTPSPSSQVIIHALQRISEAQGNGQNYELWPGPPNEASSARDMRTELYVAQELRRIGDDFNRIYFQGVERNGGAAPLPAQNEPAFLQWMGLLIGHLLQLLLRRR